MKSAPGQVPGPALLALLKEGTLAGNWVLDPRRSSVRLKSRSVWGLVPVNGVFREVSGSRKRTQGRLGQRDPHGGRGVHRHREHPARHASAVGDFFGSGNYPDITFTADRLGRPVPVLR